MEDERFGTIAVLISKVLGCDPIAPRDFFPRNRQVYEDQQEQDTLLLTERLKFAFAEHNGNIARGQNQAT